MNHPHELYTSHHLPVGLESQDSLIKSHQSFFGHGKLLLTGEYLVLDGAKSLALPTTLGQTLNVKYERSYVPKLYWKSLDYDSKQWFEGTFEFWHFDVIETNNQDVAKFLQKLLRQARKQNAHFLRDEVDIHVDTKLGFPLSWGLGSSSTLIYNIAQWAYVSPFELHFKTCQGSGYDVACAGSHGPIVYEKTNSGPHWSLVHFSPRYRDQLYFVYLGSKKDSREAISHYQAKSKKTPELIKRVSEITDEVYAANDLISFNKLINEHEKIISKLIDTPTVKKELFKDYWGEVKSLGAWGGDFVLASSDRNEKETKKYFADLGYDTFIGYDDLILDPGLNIINQMPEAIQ
jgi:mevalonate kinase